VLLVRERASPEVFVVRRADSLRFFGGYHAFPGGKVHSSDAESTVDARRTAAARELFEETGVLLARFDDRSFPPAGADLAHLRTELLDGRLPFAEVLARLNARLHAEDFVPLGHLVTPPFTALRVDTAFFLAHVPDRQQAEVWPGELTAGEWASPAAMIERWTRGECRISPPTLTLLQLICTRPLEELPRRLAGLIESWDAQALPPIYFAPDVQMLPLRTRALPPSTHTNTYLIGRDPAYLLDPGPEESAEQQRLFEALDAQQALGYRIRAVVLSHHHPDHVGAAAVCSVRYQAPIWSHPLTEDRLRDRLAVSRSLHDGDRLDLGTAPDGHPWHLETLHTPGHAAGHLAFYEPHYRLLLAGDMVSTQSSILIVPPDGDLTVYLASLRRLRALDSGLLLPSHGSPSAQPMKTIDEALAHRAKREQQLLEALASGPRRVGDLALDLYRSTPTAMMHMAEMQVRAGLRKLESEGRVQADNDADHASWRLAGRFQTRTDPCRNTTC
jgi:endoribonuclease LACTB2